MIIGFLSRRLLKNRRRAFRRSVLISAASFLASGPASSHVASTTLLASSIIVSEAFSETTPRVTMSGPYRISPEVWEMALERDERGHWFTLANGEPVPPRYVTDRVTMLFRDLHIEGSVHRCRHRYATDLLRQGVNIRVVQQYRTVKGIQVQIPDGSGFLSEEGRYPEQDTQDEGEPFFHRG